uniref:BING4 C-terminal domain-containing protein n=1 Tax=Catharus ustulatus TaxID=91951 RepID=A0A8C3V7A7_CATUS
MDQYRPVWTSINQYRLEWSSSSSLPVLPVHPSSSQFIPVPPSPSQFIPTPSQSIPVHSHSLPVHPSPSHSLPVHPSPSQFIPVHPTPSQFIPVPPSPSQSLPVPSQSIPVPSQSIPVPPSPSQSIPVPPSPPQCSQLPQFTRRHLLLGGLRGHVAALDWAQRRLLSEFSTMEPVRDLCWLHCESLLAVAQRRWLHVYDSQGLELHVLRGLAGILRLQFLPFHFLLAAVSELGLLHFLDVSVGREVAALRTRSGRAAAMAQNPASGVVALGHSNGTVSLWAPSVAEPLARILAHSGAVRATAIDGSGSLLATAGLDRQIRVFDLRSLGELQSWGVPVGASELGFSQRGLLAAAAGDLVQIYPRLSPGSPPRPFLQHRAPKPPQGLQFCPFEDVLGVGHGLGFSSILVPGGKLGIWGHLGIFLGFFGIFWGFFWEFWGVFGDFLGFFGGFFEIFWWIFWDFW